MGGSASAWNTLNLSYSLLGNPPLRLGIYKGFFRWQILINHFFQLTFFWETFLQPRFLLLLFPFNWPGTSFLKKVLGRRELGDWGPILEETFLPYLFIPLGASVVGFPIWLSACFFIPIESVERLLLGIPPLGVYPFFQGGKILYASDQGKPLPIRNCLGRYYSEGLLIFTRTIGTPVLFTQKFGL